MFNIASLSFLAFFLVYLLIFSIYFSMCYWLRLNFVLLCQTSAKSPRCTNVLSRRFFFVFLALLVYTVQYFILILKLWLLVLLVYLLFHLYIFQCARLKYKILVGGLKWNRTIDLTLIRRAL